MTELVKENLVADLPNSPTKPKVNLKASFMRFLVSKENICILLILLVGAAFRFVGLGYRTPNSDELHYRNDMSLMRTSFRAGNFRHHSEAHEIAHAPHGLVSPLISYVGGMTLWHLKAPFLPQQVYLRDNFLCRFSNAAMSVVLVFLSFLFARQFFSLPTSLIVMFMTAINPILILWARSEYLDVAMTLLGVLSFYLLWRIILETEMKKTIGKTVLLGFCVATAIGTKWPSVMFAPFIPMTYFILRIARGPWRIQSKDICFLLTYIVMTMIFTLVYVSVDSFRWAFFPDPNDQFGDMETGPWLTFLSGLNAIFEYRSIMAFFLLMGGPLFPFILISSLNKITMVLRKDPDKSKVLLIGAMLIFCILFDIMQMAALNGWRAYMLTFIFILASGYFFENISKKVLKYLVVVLTVTVLPFSLHYGLRLGEPIWGLDYFKSRNTFFDYLPPEPMHPIFTKKSE